MLAFPPAKINLGLNIVARRPDGYHDLETVFLPIALTDALEIKLMDPAFPSATPCDLHITGPYADNCGASADNLVARAYALVAADHPLPPIHAHLCKRIPTQAGLGGGSSDAAYMIRLLDERFRLNMGRREMEELAARLGADCPLFVAAEPAYATGTGTTLTPAVISDDLAGRTLVVVKPPVAVSTRDAYARITPRKPEQCCRDIVRQPVATWRDTLTNDFEHALFPLHPELADIKARLYAAGALYAQMSGSGSALFGIFDREAPLSESAMPAGCAMWTLPI